MNDSAGFIRGYFTAVELRLFGASDLLHDDNAPLDTTVYHQVAVSNATLDCLRFIEENAEDLRLSGAREEYEGWRQAFVFSFRVDDQIAQDDRVCTRWAWAGKHTGDFVGIPATGQNVTMTGTTWHRFRDGRICEGWWEYDRAGLMEQLGVLGD